MADPAITTMMDVDAAEEIDSEQICPSSSSAAAAGGLPLGCLHQSPPHAIVDDSPLQHHMVHNQQSLKVKLMTRRPMDTLVEQGIIPSLKASPALYEQRRRLVRARTGDRLKAKIAQRPERQQLVQQHILFEDGGGCVDPLLVERRRQLKRARLASTLNDQLSHRPGPLELIRANILHIDASVERAVKEGAINFVPTCQQEMTHNSCAAAAAGGGSGALLDSDESNSSGSSSSSCVTSEEPSTSEPSALPSQQSSAEHKAIGPGERSSAASSPNHTLTRHASTPSFTDRLTPAPAVSRDPVSHRSVASESQPVSVSARSLVDFAAAAATATATSSSSTPSPAPIPTTPTPTSSVPVEGTTFAQLSSPAAAAAATAAVTRTSCASFSGTAVKTELQPSHTTLQSLSATPVPSTASQFSVSSGNHHQQQQQQQQQRETSQDGGKKKKKSGCCAPSTTRGIKTKPIKFHEYKGPPTPYRADSGPLGSLCSSALAQSSSEGESCYDRLLQQQQLILQWQLQRSHKYPQILLPANQKPNALMTSPNTPVKFTLVSTSGQSGQPGPAKCSSRSSVSRLIDQHTARLEAMRVSDLRVELKQRSLPVSGSKSQLIERLRPFAADIIVPSAADTCASLSHTPSSSSTSSCCSLLSPPSAALSASTACCQPAQLTVVTAAACALQSASHTVTSAVTSPMASPAACQLQQSSGTVSAVGAPEHVLSGSCVDANFVPLSGNTDSAFDASLEHVDLETVYSQPLSVMSHCNVTSPLSVQSDWSLDVMSNVVGAESANSNRSNSAIDICQSNLVENDTADVATAADTFASGGGDVSALAMMDSEQLTLLSPSDGSLLAGVLSECDLDAVESTFFPAKSSPPATSTAFPMETVTVAQDLIRPPSVAATESSHVIDTNHQSATSPGFINDMTSHADQPISMENATTRIADTVADRVAVSNMDVNVNGVTNTQLAVKLEEHLQQFQQRLQHSCSILQQQLQLLGQQSEQQQQPSVKRLLVRFYMEQKDTVQRLQQQLSAFHQLHSVQQIQQHSPSAHTQPQHSASELTNSDLSTRNEGHLTPSIGHLPHNNTVGEGGGGGSLADTSPEHLLRLSHSAGESGQMTAATVFANDQNGYCYDDQIVEDVLDLLISSKESSSMSPSTQLPTPSVTVNTSVCAPVPCQPNTWCSNMPAAAGGAAGGGAAAGGGVGGVSCSLPVPLSSSCTTTTAAAAAAAASLSLSRDSLSAVSGSRHCGQLLDVACSSALLTTVGGGVASSTAAAAAAAAAVSWLPTNGDTRNSCDPLLSQCTGAQNCWDFMDFSV